MAPNITSPPPGALWFRIFFAGGPYSTSWNAFRYFGPLATARFDHHEPPAVLQSRGIMYLAAHVATCVAEVFQTTRTLQLAERGARLAAFQSERALRLLDVRDMWITRAGASAAIATGDREVARSWSRCFYELYGEIDGILYHSSMNPGADAVALYERAKDAIPERPVLEVPLIHPEIAAAIAEVAAALGYTVA